MDSFTDIFTWGKGSIITPEQAYKFMGESEDCIVLDVRSTSEYQEGHISGAKSIPSTELSSRAPTELPDKEVPILTYCRSGMRASAAVNTLTQMGYTKVVSLGGILNWPYEIVTG